MQQRILVIGCCGAGKSTFAKELSAKLNLPVVHLDRLFWKPGWIEREDLVFADLLLAELVREKWIIDGNYLKSLPLRLEYADTVVFLDLNRWICTWRVLKRWLFQEGEQAVGCPQKVDLPFLKFVFWDYQQVHRSRVLELKDRYSSSVNWIVLNNLMKINEWISALS
jgi:adenylate kinase family enzyme